MNALITLLSRQTRHLGLLAITACFLAAPAARAGLTLNLLMYHTVAGVSAGAGYECSAYLTTNSSAPAAPLGHYVMSSPTNAWHTEYQLTSSNFSETLSLGHYYPDFNSFIQQVTNGNWIIVVTNATSTNVFSFTITATGFTSNVFSAPVIVTFPTNNAVNVTNLPDYTWQGPSSWQGSLYVQENNSSFTFSRSANLPPTQTSWLSPATVPNGGETFFVQYMSNAGPFFVASTPLNTNTAAPISEWDSTATLETYQFINFTVTNSPGGPPSLGAALDATNLTWTTSGNTHWFAQTTNSHDGISAAQSGIVTNTQTSVLQTTVTGPGSLTFWWQTSAHDASFDLEFDVDATYVDDIVGQQPWIQESTVTIPAGTHTLTWTAYANGSTNRSDAGWVDQVQYTSQAVPVSVNLSLSLNRAQNFVFGYYVYNAFPAITAISPTPVTTNRVESPDGGIYAEVWAGHSSSDISGSPDYGTLDQLISACTNGMWTIYINKGDPSGRQFHFNVSVNGLTTNLLGPVNVLVPAINATGVPTNTPFQWSGPAGYSSVFVNALQLPSFAPVGSANLAGSATNWPSPPAMPYGTNAFYVSYTSNNFPNVTFTTPMDTNANPVSSWSTVANLVTFSETPFVVGAPVPLPVLLVVSPQQTNSGSFRFAFQTLAGRPHTLQVRTNLIMGAWITVSNFIGDGSLRQFAFPTTGAQDGFFRVLTQ